MKSGITRNAIFLQVSEAGHTPCSLQDGQQIDLFGQALAPASHSAAQVNKKEKTMNDTYGQSGSTSSASAALQFALESKLAARLPTGGLTMFIKGWKQKATPLGRQYCQLAVSARPISETDCGLWPTPNANKHTKNSQDPQKMKEGGVQTCLADAAWITGKQAYGLTAQTENKGSLNPQFPCWLMGYPQEWLNCADSVTRLPHKSRRSL